MKENIFDLLIKDHREIDELFSYIELAESSNQKAMLQELETKLEAHASAEEMAIYPVLEKVPELREHARHSYEEHDKIREAMSEACKDNSQNGLSKKVKKLKETVEHHVKEEEEKIFPKMKESFEEDALNNLVIKFRSAKKEEFAKAS